MRFVRLWFVAAALLAASSAPAIARTNAEVARDWGLIGTWRLDCSTPASSANNQDTFVVRNGRLFLDRDLGDETDSSPVVFAADGEGGTLYLVIDFVKFRQVRENVAVKSPDGSRKRVVSNRNVDTDAYSVRDGRFIQGGRELSWYVRCR